MREGALGKAEDPTVRSVLGTLYDLPGSVPAVAAGVTLSPAVGAAIGGVKTGAEAADRAVQNGASPEESILYGTGLALANYAVGRLPVEKLSSLMQAGEETEAKSILADYLKQAGVSTGKSYLKKCSGLLYDELVNQEISKVGQYQQELMKNGMEEEAALRKAREKYYRTDAFRDSLYSSFLGTAANNFRRRSRPELEKQIRAQNQRDAGRAVEGGNGGAVLFEEGNPVVQGIEEEPEYHQDHGEDHVYINGINFQKHNGPPDFLNSLFGDQSLKVNSPTAHRKRPSQPPGRLGQDAFSESASPEQIAHRNEYESDRAQNQKGHGLTALQPGNLTPEEQKENPANAHQKAGGQKEHLKGRIQKIHRKSSFSPEGSLQNQYITYRGGGKGVMGQYRR